MRIKEWIQIQRGCVVLQGIASQPEEHGHSCTDNVFVDGFPGLSDEEDVSFV